MGVKEASWFLSHLSSNGPTLFLLFICSLIDQNPFFHTILKRVYILFIYFSLKGKNDVFSPTKLFKSRHNVVCHGAIF